MKKELLFIGIAGMLIILNIAFALAHGGEDFNKTKQIIDSKIGCDKLNEEQLEGIGDYFMELMHPGSAHEQMHEMMGGENSATVKAMHINMARMMYCDNGSGMGNMMNMMDMMSGMRGGNGMMSGGMMGGNMMSVQNPQANMMQGMMGGYPVGYGYANSYWNIFLILLFIFLIVWIVYRFGIKKTVTETPLNILKNRFAKGEITKKEFNNIKKSLVFTPP